MDLCLYFEKEMNCEQTRLLCSGYLNILVYDPNWNPNDDYILDCSWFYKFGLALGAGSFALTFLSFFVVVFYQVKNREFLQSIRDFQDREQLGSTTTLLDPDTAAFREARRAKGRPDVTPLQNETVPRDPIIKTNQPKPSTSSEPSTSSTEGSKLP